MQGRLMMAAVAVSLGLTPAAAQTTGAEQVYPGAFGAPHGPGGPGWQGGWRDGRWDGVPVHGGGGPIAPGAAFGSTGPWRDGGYGQAYHRPVRGNRLPSYFVTQRFRIADWSRYGLARPARGLDWVRYYDEAVLVDRAGVIHGAQGVAWNDDPVGGDFDDGYDLGYEDGYDDGVDGADEAVTYGGRWGGATGGYAYQAGPNTRVYSSGPSAPTVVVVDGGRTVTTTTTTYEDVPARSWKKVAVRKTAYTAPAKRSKTVARSKLLKR